MESLCYRHLFLPLGVVGVVLVCGVMEVAGFGYLDSLSAPPSPSLSKPLGYLDSLSASSSPSLSTPPDDSSNVDLPTTTTKKKIIIFGGGGYLDSLQGHHPDGTATTSSIVDVDVDVDAESTRVTETEIPDDHYAKDYLGAGWGGYKHPRYGGYLDNLSSSKESNNISTSTSHNDGTSAPTLTQQEVVPTQPVRARQRSKIRVKKESSKTAEQLSAVEKAEDSLEDDDDDNMSETQKLMKQVKEAGTAGVISYAIWELGFWALSVPVCAVGYYQVTGHWPDLSNPEDQKKLGAEAFAFVNVARFAVPLRIGLALGTTPWIDENEVKRYRKKGEEEM